MNCIDFRRTIQSDPRGLSREAQDHATGCAGCREFLERHRELDASLFEALRVPAPDGLAERILVAHGLRRPRRPWLWALAATVLLAGGLTLWLPREAPDPLGAEAIAHVMAEPQSFASRTALPADFLPGELARQGVRLAVALGEVTYATLCPLAGGVARHMVVAGASGPVTVFLAPQAAAPRRRSVTRMHGMAAITLPAASGVIAIVASDLEGALAIERRLAPA